MHPADPLGKDRTRDYELTIVAGYLFDNTINILKMICSGFLDRWPRLKLCLRTCRRVQPGLAGAHAARGRYQSAAPYGHLKMPVGDYLRRLYFDTICFEPAILRYVAESFRSSISCWAATRRFRSASPIR